jgi:hypothetical protein
MLAAVAVELLVVSHPLVQVAQEAAVLVVLKLVLVVPLEALTQAVAAVAVDMETQVVQVDQALLLLLTQAHNVEPVEILHLQAATPFIHSQHLAHTQHNYGHARTI